MSQKNQINFNDENVPIETNEVTELSSVTIPASNTIVQCDTSSDDQACPNATNGIETYTIENLRRDLMTFCLPETWAYMLSDKEIHFHRWNKQFATTITVFVKSDMTAKVRLLILNCINSQPMCFTKIILNYSV